MSPRGAAKTLSVPKVGCIFSKMASGSNPYEHNMTSFGYSSKKGVGLGFV